MAGKPKSSSHDPVQERMKWFKSAEEQGRLNFWVGLWAGMTMAGILILVLLYIFGAL